MEKKRKIEVFTKRIFLFIQQLLIKNKLINKISAKDKRLCLHRKKNKTTVLFILLKNWLVDHKDDLQPIKVTQYPFTALREN